MFLSIVIPAYNEEDSVGETITTIYNKLCEEEISHEFIVVNDNSTDSTEEVLNFIKNKVPTLKIFKNTGKNGFGNAIRFGLSMFKGDCVAIVMADLSDSPDDLVLFYRTMQSGDFDCVFGSRFIKGGKVIDYPWLKYVINRCANYLIMLFLGINYNDSTNAFKLYKKEVIQGISPLISPHFNLTIELSLKSIVRGYSYTVVPNSWINRKAGESKLKIKEMGSRYFFILMYCFIEKHFSRGDYHKL